MIPKEFTIEQMVELTKYLLKCNYNKEIEEKIMFKILVLIKLIKKDIKDNYKYGCSWLDILILKRKINKLNNLLNKCNLDINYLIY